MRHLADSSIDITSGVRAMAISSYRGDTLAIEPWRQATDSDAVQMTSLRLML